MDMNYWMKKEYIIQISKLDILCF